MFNYQLDNDETLEEFKNFMNILSDNDDSICRMCLKAAESYVQNAIGFELPSFYAKGSDAYDLYKQAVFAFAGTNFTNRIAYADSAQYESNLTGKSYIGSLRGMYLIELENAEKAGDKG
ncbi:head-tail connector protein [Fructilactobacillus myrtifloralis]|uniref:Head-tail connector protein n=1 Tax=Fructilactobacillus myrtifloralis TaxID=2940301 RepID=A0ABY5BN31_9LACO|nr:head-tail connector protein [Fructilactobacillus myrtifloralis]USS85078.1 head-tail connector protein [Fructilactobacillus myrtifloralis]